MYNNSKQQQQQQEHIQFDFSSSSWGNTQVLFSFFLSLTNSVQSGALQVNFNLTATAGLIAATVWLLFSQQGHWQNSCKKGAH